MVIVSNKYDKDKHRVVGYNEFRILTANANFIENSTCKNVKIKEIFLKC